MGNLRSGNANTNGGFFQIQLRQNTRSSVSFVPSPSILSIASLFPLPEWTKRAVLSLGKVRALLVRTAHVAVAHRHGLDTVLEEEVLQLLLHFRAENNGRGNS